MKRLFTINLQDYDPNWERSKRPTVRAIIEQNGKLALIHKQQYDYYAFPGGGIEDGESYQDALIREVHEETGLRVIPESIVPTPGGWALFNSTDFTGGNYNGIYCSGC